MEGDVALEVVDDVLDVEVGVVDDVHAEVVILDDVQLQLTVWMNKLIIDDILNLKTDDKLYEDVIGCDVVDSLDDVAEWLSKADVEISEDELEDDTSGCVYPGVEVVLLRYVVVEDDSNVF